MSKAPRQRYPANDTVRGQSVRQIIEEARPEARLLLRQIHREKLEDGVRSRIARMQRDKSTPWDAAEQSSDERQAPWVGR